MPALLCGIAPDSAGKVGSVAALVARPHVRLDGRRIERGDGPRACPPPFATSRPPASCSQTPADAKGGPVLLRHASPNDGSGASGSYFRNATAGPRTVNVSIQTPPGGGSFARVATCTDPSPLRDPLDLRSEEHRGDGRRIDEAAPGERLRRELLVVVVGQEHGHVGELVPVVEPNSKRVPDRRPRRVEVGADHLQKLPLGQPRGLARRGARNTAGSNFGVST